MTADDLSAPLGQQPRKRRFKSPISISQVVAGALLLFLGVFAVWAIIGDNPFGGEPVVAVPIDLHAVTAAKKTEAMPAPGATPGLQAPDRHDAVNGSAPGSPPSGQNKAPGTKTVTIIDGKTGARQEVVIPDGGNAGNSTSAPPASPNQNLIEMTPRGPIPKIAADGTRPSEAFARPVKPIPGVADAPRIALIVSGLGVSASGTAEAITKMPEAVTLAFMPYGSDVERLVARARGEGHEILLEVPLEPFNYPENDSGPQTLLTTLTPEQNLERLHWLMSRFQGYVGIVGAMGARFTASEQSFAPIIRETAKRGLIFVDDGANPRSVAGRVAGGNSLAFAKADIVLDAVPTPGEIDHALGRLEMAARERSFAVGIASALPVSIEHIAKWAREAESRGVQLVPITAVAAKAKQS